MDGTIPNPGGGPPGVADVAGHHRTVSREGGGNDATSVVQQSVGISQVERCGAGGVGNRPRGGCSDPCQSEGYDSAAFEQLPAGMLAVKD